MKRQIKNLCVLTMVLFALAGCKFTFGKNEKFRLNPAPDKIYKYTLLRTSASYNKYPASDTFQHFPTTNNIDTFKLNFSLQNISVIDSILTFKLTFIDFFRNKKGRITFKTFGNSSMFFAKDPFAFYDSLKYFISGKSLQVVTDHKGIVKKITGDAELIRSIAIQSQESEGQVKRSISDFIGTNALKDILNRFLSAVPGFKVNESDKWVRNIILVTKAPVKLSDLYVFEQHSSDTAYVSIQSLISAEQSEGGTVYMKGKGKGIAMINYSSGMPYLYETRSETETNTTQKQYEYVNREHFLVKEYH